MIVAIMFVLFLVVVLAMAVAIRHFQLLGQLGLLDRQIEELIDQLGLNKTDYFVECEIDALIRKQNEIRRKMLF